MTANDQLPTTNYYSDMKKLFLVSLSIIVGIASCDVLNQMGEVKRFAECRFEINSVKINKLGDVNLEKYQSAKDLNFMEAMALGQKILSGNLHAHMDVNITASNNESKKAAISGVEWQLFMKNEKYGEGALNEHIEVLPGSSASFDVDVTFDLLKLISSEELSTILDIVFNNGGKRF